MPKPEKIETKESSEAKESPETKEPSETEEPSETKESSETKEPSETAKVGGEVAGAVGETAEAIKTILADTDDLQEHKEL